jgi:preprotein translocase SecE subunit
MADANKSEATGKSNPVPVQAGTSESAKSPVTQPENKVPQMGAEQAPPTKESGETAPSEGFPVWEVFWSVLVLVVFIALWKSGKITAIKTYIHETREQLRKATWPTAEELKQHIVVVLLSSLLLAVFTVAADFVVREIIWGALLNGDTVLFDKTPTQ